MRNFGNVGVVGLTVVLLAVLGAAPAPAINIAIDYTYDTSNFFGIGNPQGATGGAQAKAALEAAAAFYSGVLEDSFSEIDVPSKFIGAGGGQATFFWKQRYFNPSNGANLAEVNSEIDADRYVIYAGARDLPGSELGHGGPGGYVGGFAARSGNLTSAENAQITATASQFASESTVRGESSGFGRWGGSISFDRPTNWHFNHTTNPGGTARDFYSVALHELGHALGFGEVDSDDTTTNTAWEKLVEVVKVGSTDVARFTGTNAVTSYVPAGNVPLVSPDDTSHWEQAIGNSPVYEGSGNQTPIMVPSISNGVVRRQLTNLDAAALADIGWEIDLPGASASAVTFSSLEFSSGSASFAAMSASIAPEPASACLAIAAASALLLLNPRRRIH